MIYVVHQTLAGGGTSVQPLVFPIVPLERVVCQVQIDFPSNAAQGVGVRLKDDQQQMLPAPTSPTGWIIDTGNTVTLDDEFALRGHPFKLAVEAYNSNAGGTNCEIEVRVTIRSMTVLEALIALLQLARDFASSSMPGAVEP